MSDTLLKKDISERDLQRMRNLVTKKYGAKTVDQVGYQKVVEDHEEGDVWNENNKTWTIKNGIKMTVSKLDAVKKSLQIPLTCPNCKCAMKKKQLDNKMYSIHKMCFDCVIVMETRLKAEGKYEEYAKDIMKRNARVFIDEIEKDLEDVLRELKASESIVTENGELEDWKGGNIDTVKIRQDIEEWLSQLKSSSEL